MEVLPRPPSAGRTREGDFPPLVTPWSTKVDLRVLHLQHHPLCLCLLISGPMTWPGGSLGTHLPRTVALFPSSQPIRDRLGCCVLQCYSPKMSSRGMLPYALSLSMQPLAGSRPVVNFIRALNINAVAKFFSKLTQNYRNSSIHLCTSYSQLSPRAIRKTVCRRVYQTRRPSYFFVGEKESESRPCVVSEKILGRTAIMQRRRGKIKRGGRRRRHTQTTRA